MRGSGPPVDPGGRLGRLDATPSFGLSPQTFISGEVVVDGTVDESGTYMVKRYRLIVPEES